MSETDLFRNQHPDTRTNEEFLASLGKPKKKPRKEKDIVMVRYSMSQVAGLVGVNVSWLVEYNKLLNLALPRKGKIYYFDQKGIEKVKRLIELHETGFYTQKGIKAFL